MFIFKRTLVVSRLPDLFSGLGEPLKDGTVDAAFSGEFFGTRALLRHYSIKEEPLKAGTLESGCCIFGEFFLLKSVVAALRHQRRRETEQKEDHMIPAQVDSEHLEI